MIPIAFTGGGTGGHIYPGLAVASYLQKEGDYRIFWIGSDAGMDKTIVTEAGIEFFGIPSGKLRRYVSAKNLSDVLKVFAGFFVARKLLKREKPALLFSKGGFVSVPPCAAAASLGIPVCTHESDFSPGLATRINIRFAKKVFTAYQDTALPAFCKDKILVAGNPIRPAFRTADPAKGRAFLGLGQEDRILLVLGGSQGAQELNELVMENLPLLVKHYTVVHQTGPAWEPPGSFQDAVKTAGKKYRAYPYIREEMPQVLAAAELVLGRSGAGTIWECATLGRPMILVPLQGSGTRGDQVENARFFEQAGAAIRLSDSTTLPQVIAGLADDEARREAMSLASARIGAVDGARLIADTLHSMIEAPHG
jgi:UDP-N-acetylglucosamine--N-acetylmuramyl-(pentapeptide) pyrophosphoryl-undecaprenol N-acetylglucosamine transferase